MVNFKLRKATKNDIPGILELIRELATYEKAPNEVTITPDEIEKDGFGDHPLFEVIVAESESKQLLGMSFFYFAYSTWKGKCLYLEDIIVKEKLRGQGIGKALFEATIKKAKDTNSKRMMWQVLDWNTPAIDFYKEKYGADISDEWFNGRFTEAQLKNFNF